MKKKSSTDDASKLDRKTVERNRRIHMKGICSKLSSLVPAHYFKQSRSVDGVHRVSRDLLNHTSEEKNISVLCSYCFFEIIDDKVSQLDQLDYAATYIAQLREKIEKLKRMKEQAVSLGTSSNMIDKMKIGSWLPFVDLKDLGSTIEVILISGLQKNFMLYEVIRILHEEGAEVVSASFSTVGDKVFHTIHAQVKISRVGVETSWVRQRLQELIY